MAGPEKVDPSLLEPVTGKLPAVVEGVTSPSGLARAWINHPGREGWLAGCLGSDPETSPGPLRAFRTPPLPAYHGTRDPGHPPAQTGRPMTDDSPSTATPGSFFRQRGDEHGSSGPTTPGIEPDRVLGEFRLIRKLGEGGMGQVWEAEQLSLQRSVALKLMPSGRVLSEARLAMFEREAQAGGRLHHPSIVSVLAYGEADGIPYTAQELIGDGWSLKDVIQEARLAEELRDDWYTRIATFIAATADALQVAHDAGVIHRDIKPANILVAEDDAPTGSACTTPTATSGSCAWTATTLASTDAVPLTTH